MISEHIKRVLTYGKLAISANMVPSTSGQYNSINPRSPCAGNAGDISVVDAGIKGIADSYYCYYRRLCFHGHFRNINTMKVVKYKETGKI